MHRVGRLAVLCSILISGLYPRHSLAATGKAPGATDKAPGATDKASQASDADCPNSAPDKKTLIFDHQAGRIIAPFPAQLEVEDGEVFGIIFCHTYPAKFNYELKGIGGTDIASASFSTGTQSVDAADLTTATVTWRHDRHFPLYQVSVSLRTDSGTPAVSPKKETHGNAQQGAQPAGGQAAGGQPKPVESPQGAQAEAPKLFSYTFPLWIKTVGWNLSFTSGIAFSGLTNRKFFVMTGADGTKTVQQDTRNGDSFTPDIVALANLSVPETWRVVGNGLGLGFGLGLNSDGNTRYFLGPTWTLGKGFILGVGWAGGKISALPNGQQLNRPPINGDNTLNSLGSKFSSSWFAGIAFTFTNKETEFINALGPAQKVTDTGKPADQQPKPADQQPKQNP
jgi:hypothetical protein